MSSLAEEENVPREAETSARHAVRSQAPPAVLLPQPVCLPFCVASLRRSKEALALWEAGVELSLAEGTALQACGGNTVLLPLCPAEAQQLPGRFSPQQGGSGSSVWGWNESAWLCVGTAASACILSASLP